MGLETEVRARKLNLFVLLTRININGMVQAREAAKNPTRSHANGVRLRGSHGQLHTKGHPAFAGVVKV